MDAYNSHKFTNHVFPRSMRFTKDPNYQRICLKLLSRELSIVLWRRFLFSCTPFLFIRITWLIVNHPGIWVLHFSLHLKKEVFVFMYTVSVYKNHLANCQPSWQGSKSQLAGLLTVRDICQQSRHMSSPLSGSGIWSILFISTNIISLGVLLLLELPSIIFLRCKRSWFTTSTHNRKDKQNTYIHQGIETYY